MSEKDLPEELLLHILQLCVQPTPEGFLRFPQFTSRSPHHAEPRQTQVLLVCKRWHRIALPLLYTSLRLTSPAHATSAALVLSSHPSLGRAVRQLRLESGCLCTAVHEVHRHTSHVTRLYVSLDHRSDAHADVLRRALPLVSPIELRVMDLTKLVCMFDATPREQPVARDGAMVAIEDAIASSWTELVRAATLSSLFTIDMDC